MPLLAVLGSSVMWALLPFLILALGALIFALDRNRRDNQVIETLSLNDTEIALTRRAKNQRDQVWTCNRYWTRVDLHDTDGPVPNYVTLSGNGRTAEIGAFLSEDERQDLFNELVRILHETPDPAQD